MRDAMLNDSPVVAGPDAPRQARCPVCGSRVTLRRRRDTGTWYYRHTNGGDDRCPRWVRFGARRG